jgi:hypothetical protein
MMYQKNNKNNDNNNNNKIKTSRLFIMCWLIITKISSNNSII